jgi:asparagine synthase (glutamine-hydrolysing)
VRTVCGLCGIVALGRAPEVATVAAMSEQIAHRGPDGAGIFADQSVALGSRRLAILDLSDAGAQPFSSTDGKFHLAYNGEVYNYRELRTELEALGHRFSSASDTEVILEAYREWGERCVERFNGMWAFGIWDTENERLFCSRDRFGVKPFYYTLHAGRLAFASELKAFRADPQTRLSANAAVVRDFVARDWFDHTSETFFAGIVKLPPAHNLIFDRSGLHLRPYWELEVRDPPTGDPTESVRELFVDSVRLRLRSDVPIGTCLSGGLDSSAIAVVTDLLLRTETENARPVGERQQTFTAYFEQPGFDERPFAQAVVDQTRAAPHWVTFTAADLVENLPAIVEAQDEPFRSTSICAGWYVMREVARAGIKVALDGQGGDEVLAGYPAYFSARYGDLFVRGRLGALGAELNEYRRLYGGRRTLGVLGRPFVPKEIERRLRERRTGSAALLHADLRSLPQTRELDSSPFPDRLRRLLTRILTVRGLPELLHSEDRNSMTHSIEARVPFLDYRLVELLFSLDGGHLIDRGRTKAILRRALADLLPPVVRERTDKLGFVTPEASWLRGPLGDLAADVFASQSFRERGFVDARAVQQRLGRHRRGELNAGFELWRALNLELWARRFLDGQT